MHEAIFEANWRSEDLMPRHREVVGEIYRGQGCHVISLDWTLSHHDKGPKIYGVKKGFDYVKRRYGLFQTVLTATVSNSKRVDGIEIEVQHPEQLEPEKVYLKNTALLRI